MILHCAKCGKKCLIMSPDRNREYQFEVGSRIVCRECLERFGEYENEAMKRKLEPTNDMPDFMKGIFK